MCMYVFSVPHTKEKLSNVKETIWLWKRMSEEHRWFQLNLQNMFHIVSDKPLLPPSSSSVCSWTICRLTPAASSVSPKRVSWSWALLIQPAAPPRPPCPPPPSWPMACLHPSIRLRPHLTSCRNGSSPLPRWVELRDTLKHTCRVHGMHINLNVFVCVQGRHTELVRLTRPLSGGLGFSVVGLNPEGTSSQGVFVKHIQPGGVAHRFS